MTILIKNGIVVDPASRTEKKAEVLIDHDKIVKIDNKISEKADEVIDAKGCYVMPGFIDLHVHLRDPGLTHKETIETGARAAARGGVTTILAMPNTKPVVDNADIVNYVKNKAEAVADVHVLQIGSVTKAMEGQVLSDIDEMVKAGIPAISEDGKSVMNAEVYREAMIKAKENDIPVFAHCEDINLVNGGVMNSDEQSEKLGLPGITNSVENIIVARDIMLAKDTGVRLHLCHCSTYESVLMLEHAKSQGIAVTAEVCPHHFILTSEDVCDEDANYKMNPPLRTRKDVDELIRGLKDGTIEVIATDHAPHTMQEKGVGFKRAPFGIVGLETSAALTYTELVKTGILTIVDMAEKMSYNPAKIIGSDRGVLEVGAPADIVIFDPKAEYEIDPSKFRSKGKNTPFAGRKVCGQVVVTLVDGMVVYDRKNDN